MIELYNSGALSIEQLFAELVTFTKDLSEEEQRHLRENISEEELAVFDILTRPGPDLTPMETEVIKKVCKDLLAKLKTEKLVLAWRTKRTTRAAVRVEIEKMLDSGLPEKYTTEIFEQKCGVLFQHVLEKYPDQGASVYSQSGVKETRGETPRTRPAARRRSHYDFGFGVPREEAVADWWVEGYSVRVVFEKMLLWMDPVRRSGPEAMAVDEWLLETAELPVLRVYRWAGEWASLGYFGEIAAARAAFPAVNLVRRWTGGGMVDHRADWTYTIVAPHGEPLAGWRGTESYRRIHSALAEALLAGGVDARMSGGAEETGAALCFENPVHHDLLGAGGKKLAGAGQRRARLGLLHQGSVAAACVDEDLSVQRAEDFAGRISPQWARVPFLPDPDDLARRVAARYADDTWTNRR